ncbi:putative RNA methyltransferase [Dictyobacter aurantiacus]|uniref:23S rRNA (Guanine(745)-N(1))-methyltransferase n=1 Tax=Dictyobacter aurantiacus TaxID=1936993 RepID=A0A401ZDQ4_9CHLR|nr:methyltransferase domain-containing protein [Dictyobacter aurantiacus]GCE04828.1 23S rRNA (guanine(745)-N(1))-methyltransferase [Dictyobacter aurantiacus]
MVLTDVAPILVCPVCRMPLNFEQAALRCERGHAFDVAKEGYVNLLRKKLPGDTKDMVVARRAFFDQGYYEPVSDLLNRLLGMHLPATIEGPLRIMDAGCGEGYYLARLQQALKDKYGQVHGVGIDISKDAIRLAARRYAESFFLVANLKEELPLADAALSSMVNVFAPRNVAEYARVLQPGAPLLIIIPGSHHLEELRHSLHLLNIEENKQQHVIEQFASTFDLLALHTLTYKLELQQGEIEQLVMMTPNYWHQSTESQVRLAELVEFTTTVDFVCLVFQRKLSVSE